VIQLLNGAVERRGRPLVPSQIEPPSLLLGRDDGDDKGQEGDQRRADAVPSHQSTIGQLNATIVVEPGQEAARQGRRQAPRNEHKAGPERPQAGEHQDVRLRRLASRKQQGSGKQERPEDAMGKPSAS
jgi:hypothetical protein